VGLVANHELREDSCGPDAESRSAALFVKRDVLLESQGMLADYRRRDAAHNPGADASGVVAESGIELHQCIRCIFLILNGKIFPVAAYFAASHLERFGVAHITWAHRSNSFWAGDHIQRTWTRFASLRS